MQLGRNGSVLRYHLVEMDKEDDYLNDMEDNGSFSFIFLIFSSRGPPVLQSRKIAKQLED